MTDLEMVEELLDIAKKNDIFNMTTYDFSKFESRVMDAIEQYTLTPFDMYKRSLEDSHIKYVEAEGSLDNNLDDKLYIATCGSWDDGIIMVQEFNNNGTLNDTYVADACKTLEDFVTCF